MTFIKRADLGRPLTWGELDSNFEQVDSYAAAAASSAAASQTQAQSASQSAQQALQYQQGAEAAAASAEGAVDALRQEIADPDGATDYPDLQMARWRDEGDIRGWGAKGDANEAGTVGTDDTSAIRAAIGSGKKKLKIPANHYFLVTDTIIIPSDISIVGEDRFTSCIVAAVTMEGSLDVMQNTGYNKVPITFDKNIVLSNFRIHANGFTRTKTADGEWGRCLRTGAVRNIYLPDMVFQEGPQHCLDLACWRNNHENAGHAGVVQGMTENAVVTNCDIIDYCRDDGLTTHGASGVTIDDCVSRITDYAKSVNNYSITQNGFEIDDGSYNVIVTNCRAYCNNTFSKGFSTANHENNPPPHNVRFINCDTYEGVSGVSLLGAINSSVAFGTENWRARNYVIHNCSLIYPHAATGADYPSRAVEARIVMDVDVRNFRVQMRGENGEEARSPCAITNIDTAVNVSVDGVRIEGVPDGDMGTGFGTDRSWFRIANVETKFITIKNISIDNIGWADNIIKTNPDVTSPAALLEVDGVRLGRTSTDGRTKIAVRTPAYCKFDNVVVPSGVQALRIGRLYSDRSSFGRRVEVNYDSPRAIIGGLRITSETAADGSQPASGILFDRQFTSASNQNGKGCIAFRTSVAVPGSFNIAAYDEDTGRYEPMLASTWTASGTVKKYIAPIVDGDMNNGNAGARWSATYAVKFMFTATVGYFYGTGSPEGVLTAGVGSEYSRTDGGASTTKYVKESGTGNTGWVAK